MNTKILKNMFLGILAISGLAYAGSQTDLPNTLQIMKENAVIYEIPLADLDSIVLVNKGTEPILAPSINATIAVESQLRAGVDHTNEDYKSIGELFFWEDNDAMKAHFTKDNTTPLTYTASGSNGVNTTFTTTETLSETGAHDVLAFYPASFADGKQLDLRNVTQDGNNPVAHLSNFLVKRAEGSYDTEEAEVELNLEFKHLTSLFRFAIWNNTDNSSLQVAKITISATNNVDGDNLFVTNAVWNEGTKSFTTGNVAKKMVLNVTNGNFASAEGGKDIFYGFMPIIPVNLAASGQLRALSILVEFNDGSTRAETKNVSLINSFDAGKSYFFQIEVNDENHLTINRSAWTATTDLWTGNLGNLFDNDLTTQWSSGPQSVGRVLTVDMKAPQTFNQIIFDQSAHTGDRPTDFEVYVSNDGTTWGSAIAAGNGANLSPSTKVTFPEQTAQFIQIKLTGSGTWYWKVTEFYINTIELDYRFGWTATISGLNSAGLANMFDNDLGTQWDSGGSQKVGDYLIVDMKTTRAISQIIFDQTMNNGDRPTNFDVYVSNDGITWGSAITSGVGIDNTAATIVNFPEQNARYIKIELTVARGNWWKITEFHAKGGSCLMVPKVRIRTFEGGPLILTDSNGTLAWTAAADGDNSLWYEIPATGSDFYLKNVGTGRYIYREAGRAPESCDNDWEWNYALLSNTNSKTDGYKFRKGYRDWTWATFLFNVADISPSWNVSGNTSFALSGIQVSTQTCGMPAISEAVVMGRTHVGNGNAHTAIRYEIQAVVENPDCE
jgi:hypothetical protein